jgi:hypothetical protein
MKLAVAASLQTRTGIGSAGMHDTGLCPSRVPRRRDHKGCFSTCGRSAQPFRAEGIQATFPRGDLTLQIPSINTPAETDSCFVGVFHTLNQRHAQLMLLKTKHCPTSQAGRRRWAAGKCRLTGGQPPNTLRLQPICSPCKYTYLCRLCTRNRSDPGSRTRPTEAFRTCHPSSTFGGDALYTSGSARGLSARSRAVGRSNIGPSKSRRNTPYGIVCLNRFHRRIDTKMDTKRKVGRADSQAGFGVRFGVHFSTKRGRFGGFQRLSPSRVSGWESAK